MLTLYFICTAVTFVILTWNSFALWGKCLICYLDDAEYPTIKGKHVAKPVGFDNWYRPDHGVVCLSVFIALISCWLWPLLVILTPWLLLRGLRFIIRLSKGVKHLSGSAHTHDTEDVSRIHKAMYKDKIDW